MTKKRKRKISGPVKTLIALLALTGVLLIVDRVREAREIALATGPASEAQRKYFVESADRPGVELFYKGLSTKEKVAMAKRLAKYSDAKSIALTGKLLDTYDSAAYKELTHTLTVQAKSNPKDAIPLINIGATQPKFAIRKALLDATPTILPELAAALSDKALQGSAKRLLLDAGAQAEPYVRPLVKSKEASVRLESASLLGEYRKPESLDTLKAAFKVSKPPERIQYLSAIVGIGVPQNRPFLEGVFTFSQFTDDERYLAARGLAKIGTLQSTAPLAKALLKAKGPERDRIINALAESGDKTLELTTLRAQDRVILATRLSGPKADALLSSAIDKVGFGAVPSLDLLYGREALTPALRKLALQIDPKKESYKIMQVLRALSSTESGQKALAQLQQDSRIGGLAMRTLRLTSGV
ncbi:MAG: hypothetical protein KF784_07045 [Fimbriimonadaceae bacterium]|nr:hypothetical protein [Fimbriimonadaceae bacterium]